MIKSQRELSRRLSETIGFTEPKLKLRQYLTPPNIAAALLWTAFMNGDIKGKVVFDLGCGTGILSIGASLLSALKVKGFDIDASTLSIAERNAAGLSNVEFIEMDVKKITGSCDTVIMNPPFMVKGGVSDRAFLDKAFSIAKRIYSIHNLGTHEFINKYSLRNGFKPAVIDSYKFPLKYSYKFHEKEKVNFMVGLWFFKK